MTSDALVQEVDKIVKRDFPTFTDVQKQAIPLIASGKNVLVIAPTGSGKTETAMLPILSKIVQRSQNGKPKGIQVIYITPLKALNRDIFQRIEKICKELNITIGVRHGDTTATERQKQRDNPPQLLVTTPETLQSVLIAPKLSDSLVHLRHVIVDEVHELYESKRGVQLCLALERLEEKTPGFQRIGLSATIGNPTEVAEFLGKDTIVCNTVQKRKVNLNVEYITRPQGTEATRLKALLHLPLKTIARIQRIEEIIHEHKSSLIFVNTRYAAESISNALYAVESLKHGVSVHHSSLSKDVRVETERQFKQQEVKAIVCTSSLELGIDIGTIEAVVQYSSPRQVTRLLQRVGRSGHKHYLEPKGIILPLDEVDLAESIAVCHEAERNELEQPEHYHNAFDVLAHFIAGMATEYHTIQLQRVYEIAKRAYSYKNLSIEDFTATARQIAGHNLVNIIQRDGETLIQTRGTRTKLYYYENVSTIPDEKRIFIRDAATRKNVAVLDEAFVSEFVETNGVFICQGRAWKVLSMDEREVIVEATSQVTAAIPDWVGEEIPVTMQTAKDVAQVISGKDKKTEKESENENEKNATTTVAAITRTKIGKTEETILAEFRESQARHFLPGKEIIVEENVEDNTIVIHSFYGLRANETIARTIAFLLAQRDKSLKTRASPYHITLEFSRPVGGDEVITVLKKLSGKVIETVLKSALPSTRIYRHKFIHVAKRFGFLSKSWNATAGSISRIISTLPQENVMCRETLSELMHSRLSLEDASLVANGIANGEIKVSKIYTKNWSPLAKSAIEYGGSSELFTSTEPTQDIIEAFANSLKEKIPTLYCTFCKNNFSIILNEVKINDKIKCPNCSSTQVTLTAFSGKEHKKESEKIANLISAYGVRALYALETYGIGPQTAGRVLSRLHKTDEEFYHDLLDSQKNFIKNRKFWKI
ncbi:MAG: DEAD/DEAH box helicase [Candidatus Micrarchaeota archaeon]